MRTCLLVCALAGILGLGAGCHGNHELQTVEFDFLGSVDETQHPFCCDPDGIFPQKVAEMTVSVANPIGFFAGVSRPGCEAHVIVGLTIHDVNPPVGVRFLVNGQPFDPAESAVELFSDLAPVPGPESETVVIEVLITSCDVTDVEFDVRLTTFCVDLALGRDPVTGHLVGLLRPLETATQHVTLTSFCEEEPEEPPPPPGTVEVTVEFAGFGAGQVDAMWENEMQQCVQSCIVAVPRGALLGLRAIPTEPSVFSHWEGTDDADGDVAILTPQTNRTVRVFFE